MTPSGFGRPLEEVRDRIKQARVVAILRAQNSLRVPAAVEVLVESGITCVEITLTTPQALHVVDELRGNLGDEVLLGAGTVTSVEQASEAVQAGARFLVAPTTDPSVLAWCTRNCVPMIPGALTPTEIVAAQCAGAAAVKVFPVDCVGGVQYIRALRAPLPDVPLLPTGGVKIQDVQGYLAVGCMAVGIGAPLIGDALSVGGGLGALRARAREVMVAADNAAEAVE